ncbi:MAG: prolyl oligopeptidase family serine peptidase [Vicingaceae bacterium]
MKISLLTLLFSILLLACQHAGSDMKIQYPDSHKIDQADGYFGKVINDPYRWLENDTSAQTADWVRRQNILTDSILGNIPERTALRARLEELVDYERYSAPIRAGEYVFFYKNNGLQNQSVIYRKHVESGVETVFLDPNELDGQGTTSVGIAGISKDDQFVTLSYSKGGSDWQEFVVFDIASASPMSDSLQWVKFSGADWHGHGFYYSRFPEPVKGADYSASNSNQSVYYHELGTDQSSDRLVFEDKEHPNRYNSVDVTEDENYLILYIADGTDGYECHYKKLPENGQGFTPLFTGFDHKSSVVDHIAGRFLVRTDIGAPNYRLVSVDPESPEQGNWQDLIPEEQFPLQSVRSAGGYLFASYLKKATSHITRFDQGGKNAQEISLPGPGSAGGFSGKKEDSILFWSFSSFTYPGIIYKYNVASNTSEVYFSPKLSFNPEEYESKQVTYPSKDGEIVSMFIVHKRGIKMDGKNPLLLYGYGGFNISITPRFSTYIIPWLENGGIYAVPNLRGGGEYGETWHKAGMLLNKQNVFNDFISAAEYLIDNNYTSSEKLVISGRSNGGLLVGAVMTQRPDLMKVALPGVGVLDMLRYHKFTVGHGWIPEYGSSEDPEDFKNLLSYSPLHNLKKGVRYPATLIYTGDHDDRVVPAHSFKFAATLQECTGGELPCLIRIETDAGHGSGKPIAKLLDEEADKLAFSFYHTGLTLIKKN